MTSAQAKRFFIDRIIAQAETEAQPLTDAERRMLAFTESEDDPEGDSAFVESFDRTVPQADYETKIARLLKRAYARDLELDPASRATYRDANVALQHADYYLGVMVGQALGPPPIVINHPAGRLIYRTVLAGLLLVPATFAFVLAVSVPFVFLADRGDDPAWAFIAAATAVAFFGAAAWYLVRLWRRERS